MKEEALRDELLPVLLTRIGRLTERLVSAGESFERDTEEARRIGWLLGFLSTLAGEDLLGSRREPDELALALDLVGEWVVARGASWTLVGDVPVVVQPQDSWAVSARCAGAVVGAARAEPLLDRVRVDFLGEGDAMRLQLRLESADARARELEENLPRAWFR